MKIERIIYSIGERFTGKRYPDHQWVLRRPDGRYMSQGPWGETIWVTDIGEAYPHDKATAEKVAAQESLLPVQRS